MEIEDFDGFTDKHARAMAARELYNRSIVNVQMGAGGAQAWGHSNGAGGAGYAIGGLSVGNNSGPWRTFNFEVPAFQVVTEQTPEERQDMAWTNPEAASIAREILADEKKEGLRETVTAAVQHFRDLLADAHCGSVFSFMKENDEGKHYFYAAVKNNDVWYTTAQNPRTIEGDDAFITWLIGLGAHESKAAELTSGFPHVIELGAIDTTATDES